MVKRNVILIATCIFVALLLSAFVCGAQFSDNFSDGNFTIDPTWQPDDDNNWVIENNRLRSNSQTASSSFYISTPSTKATHAQWEFYMNLQFNTSSANFVDVYLVSANQDLSATGNNGYFVRIGGTPDEISLYKISNGTSSILINGTDGVTNFSNNTLLIKVIRDQTDLWTLFYDNTGSGNNYVAEPSITDNSFSTSNFFGIRITQSTASFFNRHFFDDFYVGDIIVDTDPPVISSVTPVSSQQLDVVFNEKVEPASAQLITNYSVDNSVGQPSIAVLQADEKTVRLTFDQNFPNAVNCQLTVTNVKDLFDNAVVSASQGFLFFLPVAAQYKDIIITEIFADPAPQVGLPDAEFIEIYNRSESPFQLQNWKITDGSSTGNLPTQLIMPGDYIILCGTGSVSLFSSYGTTLGVTNFPTLNNAGDALVLRDNNNVVVDNVTYTDSWYKDDDKKQGGYTLELIDPENVCGESENWVAAEAANGGTPGTQNSVFANKPDLTGPRLLGAVPLSALEVLVTFNEKLDGQLPALTSFTLTPTIMVSSLMFTDESLRFIKINLTAPLQLSTQYTLTASVYDCSGNLIQDEFKEVTFGLPEAAAVNDVVVNEVLFNPRPFGVDFVEVLNRSTKYLNIKNWSVGNYVEGSAMNLRTIATQDFLVAPGAILVFTTDPATIQSHYPKANMTALHRVSSLPTMADTEGSVCLVDSKGVVVDFFIYSSSYHSAFLRNKEGVSLERISAEVSASVNDNWKSASATEGFATPGYGNSNARNKLFDGEVVVMPEVFEPVIGHPDFTQIQYNFGQGGFIANVKIIDAQGRLIKTLANNVLLGTTGFFRWDGDTDDGAKARTGYYVVWLEVFNGNGKVETFRKRVVIASRR
jgi:hypothetical protein